MRDITIVTAFFDIGRGNWPSVIRGYVTPHYLPRATDRYFEYFERLSKVQNDMVIFTSFDLVDKIKEIRQRNAPNSKTYVLELDLQKSIEAIKPHIQMIQNRPEYINLVTQPNMPEYWNPEYVLINFMKTDFVVEAYKKGMITTELSAWIDFGYARDDKCIPKENFHWKFDFAPGKMHFFNLRDIDYGRPIFDIVRTNTVYMMGCHIVGDEQSWLANQKRNYNSLNHLLACGLIDDDQTIMLMNYKSQPTEYILHPINEHENGWYVIFRKFSS
jgi:protein YibB